MNDDYTIDHGPEHQPAGAGRAIDRQWEQMQQDAADHDAAAEDDSDAAEMADAVWPSDEAAFGVSEKQHEDAALRYDGESDDVDTGEGEGSFPQRDAVPAI